MKKIPTEIPGVVILEPRVFGDNRGWFSESWNEQTLRTLGLDVHFVQDNESFSRRGVLRGLHFQKGEATQAKLVRVLSGEVLDVAVDLRFGSSTFGKHVAVRLSDQNHRQLFIPKGFAHGFVVLSETAHFAYKCDAFYAPETEGSVYALDPELGIDWLVPENEQIFSEKDRIAPSFSLYRESPDFFFNSQERKR